MLAMTLNLPNTPGRGRSRFSKALPIAPGEALRSPDSSPALISKYSHSPLPPIPKENMIARRMVGGNGGELGLSKAPSIDSISSQYSDPPGLSRSFSDASTKESPSGGDSDAATGPAPPLPSKDVQREQAQHNPTTVPNKLLDKPFADFLDKSPPRTELWKRRSTSSSNSSIHFADLKLQKSNGSTASPPRNPPPRSLSNRKPVPNRPAPPQPDLMGNKITKLRDKAHGEKGITSEESSQNEAPQKVYPSPQRLHAPEYLKADKQHVSVTNVLSPRTPFTPPDDKAPAVPQKSDSRTENIRPDVARSESQSTTIRPVIPVSSHSRTTSEALSVTSEAPTLLAPHPERPTPARILSPHNLPDKTSPLNLPSPINGIHFPSLKSPAPIGTVFPGLPLDVVHLDCYQNHKFMRSTKNTFCPMGCMICKKKDTEPRWRCTWCCLSSCGSCMQVLSAVPGKDLKVCLERIRK